MAQGSGVCMCMCVCVCVCWCVVRELIKEKCVVSGWLAWGGKTHTHTHTNTHTTMPSLPHPNPCRNPPTSLTSTQISFPSLLSFTQHSAIAPPLPSHTTFPLPSSFLPSFLCSVSSRRRDRRAHQVVFSLMRICNFFPPRVLAPV